MKRHQKFYLRHFRNWWRWWPFCFENPMEVRGNRLQRCISSDEGIYINNEASLKGNVWFYSIKGGRYARMASSIGEKAIIYVNIEETEALLAVSGAWKCRKEILCGGAGNEATYRQHGIKETMKKKGERNHVLFENILYSFNGHRLQHWPNRSSNLAKEENCQYVIVTNNKTMANIWSEGVAVMKCMPNTSIISLQNRCNPISCESTSNHGGASWWQHLLKIVKWRRAWRHRIMRHCMTAMRQSLYYRQYMVMQSKQNAWEVRRSHKNISWVEAAYARQ